MCTTLSCSLWTSSLYSDLRIQSQLSLISWIEQIVPLSYTTFFIFAHAYCFSHITLFSSWGQEFKTKACCTSQACSLPSVASRISLLYTEPHDITSSSWLLVLQLQRIVPSSTLKMIRLPKEKFSMHFMPFQCHCKGYSWKCPCPRSAGRYLWLQVWS